MEILLQAAFIKRSKNLIVHAMKTTFLAHSLLQLKRLLFYTFEV